MTHFPNIHQRAENMVRDSRGRLTLREAYAELSRRGQLAKVARKVAAMPKPATPDWRLRADLA